MTSEHFAVRESIYLGEDVYTLTFWEAGICQDVSSAEESAFPAPTFLVKSGSVDAVPSGQVSVLWSLFKIKPVVSYLLSRNRIVLLVFIVTISKVRKGKCPLQRGRESPPGFQGAL